MDLSKYRNKLIGSKEERAVSPVIGVILMVAITVILAAVIAAFVLDMGDSMGQSSVNAGVSTEVSDTDRTVTIDVENMGDAEKFVLRGDVSEDLSGELTATGDSVTLAHDTASSDDDLGQRTLGSSESGEVNVVAINGDSETVVTSFEWEGWT